MATLREAGAPPAAVDPGARAGASPLDPGAVARLVGRVVTSGTAGEHVATAPFTGAPLVALPLSSPDDVARAVGRARAAQAAWRRVPVRQRARVLDRVGELVLRRQREILDLVQLESGKARRSAFEEVADVAQTARHYAVRGPRYLAERSEPGMLPLLTGVRVARRPVGVVGVIAPWNYPLTLALSEALPALLAGNAVVVKPDPQTSLSALWVAGALHDAGLPEDLFLVVAGGVEVGRAVAGEADHVAFTGSTQVGREVAAAAGRRLVGATLELGGKNALYVAADADVAASVDGIVRACFANAGQLCMAIERLVLHEAVADAFLDRFVPAVRALRLGAGLDYSADVGSLVSPAQLERVRRHVEDAVGRGARVLAGGAHRPDVGPFFYEPTVLDGVPADALCAQEETFGPVVSVRRVACDDDAVTVMNDTPFGLSASIWSRDVARARRLAARVEAGTVVVNDGYMSAWGSTAAPMGGFKASGQGRRHGREVVEAVTEAQTVVAQRGQRFGVSLDALYGLGGEAPSRVLTAAMHTLRVLRRP
ncbi:succinic semialdehyde dehydrogenase [Xylanimonas oleitrophica]|uniref:Succinic semialdehyde dehydrogenase n=1 Tax=Xylanimonas oleitrophica TaxID=2607479 RepID=A0A2W5X3E4_9MICO|nr:succinic semialdehyde dehydrogenase [Xylanimonas oleitrophica]PZR54915.1 succinic semialdehyde dehydrogenase [Xylanimonas oleitrophica]